MKKNKYKLKLNETFPLRSGWLQKGINIISEKEDAFKKAIAPKEFGLGTNMCSALKYYLKSSNIIADGKQGMVQLTEDFGKVIFREDRFCELLFTIFLIHIQLVSNKRNCIVYNVFFNNKFNNFTKDYLVEYIKEFLLSEDEDFKESSLISDVQVMLRSYVKIGDENPEENMFSSPLSLLGLLKFENGTYKKTMPSSDFLDFRVVYYSITNAYKEEFINNKPIKFNLDDIIQKPNNPMSMFNLSVQSLITYLEEMEKNGFIDFVKTAGLNTVIIKKRLSLQELYEDYKQGKGINLNV